MAMTGAALKRSLLNHLRIPVCPAALSSVGSTRSPPYLTSFSGSSLHTTTIISPNNKSPTAFSPSSQHFPKLDPSKVTPDAHFQRDLGLDSLDNVQLAMALEEEFKLEIPDLEADKIDSSKLAIEYIYNHPLSS